MLAACGVVLYLATLFEKLPEWARWVLYVPMVALVVAAGNMFSYTFVAASNGSRLWWRLICDLGGVVGSIWFMIYVAGAIAPRFKCIFASLIFFASLGVVLVISVPFWRDATARAWSDNDYLNAERSALWLLAGPVIWWSVIASLKQVEAGTVPRGAGSSDRS